MFNMHNDRIIIFQEIKCTERDGWCARDIIDKCREIMFNITERLLTKDETVQQSFKKSKLIAVKVLNFQITKLLL